MEKLKLSLNGIVCVTCLARDRELQPIQCVPDIQELLPDIQLNISQDKMCWECHAALIKFVRFRQKASKAQQVFAKFGKGNMTSMKSFSNLKWELMVEGVIITMKDQTSRVEIQNGENEDHATEEEEERVVNNCNFEEIKYVGENLYAFNSSRENSQTELKYKHSEDADETMEISDSYIENYNDNEEDVLQKLPENFSIDDEETNKIIDRIMDITLDKIIDSTLEAFLKDLTYRKKNVEVASRISELTDHDVNENEDSYVELQTQHYKSFDVPRGRPLNRYKNVSRKKMNKDEMEQMLERERENNCYKNAYFKCEKCVYGYDNVNQYTDHLVKHDEKVGQHLSLVDTQLKSIFSDFEYHYVYDLLTNDEKDPKTSFQAVKEENSPANTYIIDTCVDTDGKQETNEDIYVKTLEKTFVNAEETTKNVKRKNLEDGNLYGYIHDPLINNDTDITNVQVLKQENTYNYSYTDDDEIPELTIDEDVKKTIENTYSKVETVNALKKKNAQHKNYMPRDIKKRIVKKVKKKKITNDLKDSKELMEKFTTIEFTEEEMIKRREDKRNQPNFKKIPYKCDLCVLGFTKKETFDEHLEKKHSETAGPLQCDVCHVRFATAKSVSRHRRQHYVSHRCKFCDYSTALLWSALNHSRMKHGADTSGKVHCGQCELVASTPEDLADHIRTEHSLICNECGEKFKGKNTLRTHKIRIHGEKRQFICDICSKSFKCRSRLESHISKHSTALATRLAYCSSCDIQYKNIYVYRSHLRNSANHADTQYPCPDCDKKFASKVYWTKHYNFYHLRKSQYSCEICNKLFISDWRLKNHKQKHHGLSRSRDHSCDICGKKFFTLSTLRGHELTHSEQRSYMCEDCGDTFKQRPALYTHARLVHRAKKVV